MLPFRSVPTRRCTHSVGFLDPFANDNQPETVDDQPQSPSEHNASLTASNSTEPREAGPSLDLIDSHAHSHDDDNASAVETAKRALIQPSIDFLEAQLHDGNEHAHNGSGQTNRSAADLNDFQRWLKEQNQTDQLNRFLLLQKEVKRFGLQNTQNLTDKLNKTIEELKSEARTKSRRRHEL